MPEQKHDMGWIAGATTSLKAVNQDAIRLVKNTAAPLSAVVLADGLGSHYKAEIASETAVSTIAAGLGNLTSADVINTPSLFQEAYSRIKELASKHDVPPDLDHRYAFGTTALCAVETNDQIIIAYAGNGAIFHIRGDFNTFPESQLLPWTVLNYLNPHAQSRDGRNVLYKLLSPEARTAEIKPTVLTLNKDQDLFGDIILCCTDGVYSYDQTQIGYDPEHKIWIHMEPSIVLFLEKLNTFFKGDCTEDGLQACVDSYLKELQDARMMADDCTVGVLVTETAHNYQAGLRKARIV